MVVFIDRPFLFRPRPLLDLNLIWSTKQTQILIVSLCYTTTCQAEQLREKKEGPKAPIKAHWGVLSVTHEIKMLGCDKQGRDCK